MRYIKWIILTCIILILLGGYSARFEFRKPTLDVHFFHLDRGRSIFIRTPENKTVLIDGGQSGDVLRELTKIFPFYRRNIDLLIFTSGTPKNVGGLSEVVKRFEIQRIAGPSHHGTSTAYDAFEKEVGERGLEIERVKKGDRILFGGLEMEVLFPDPGFKFNKTSLPELVLLVKQGPTKILLLGDVSKTIQKSFISRVGTVSVLEYAHGAADSRVSHELFEEVQANVVVINKKETSRVSSLSKKKFDIGTVSPSRIINLDEKGSVRLSF